MPLNVGKVIDDIIVVNLYINSIKLAHNYKPLLTTSPNMYIYTARWLRIQLLS